MTKIRSRQPCISMNFFCTEFSKAQVFPVCLVNGTVRRQESLKYTRRKFIGPQKQDKLIQVPDSTSF